MRWLRLFLGLGYLRLVADSSQIVRFVLRLPVVLLPDLRFYLVVTDVPTRQFVITFTVVDVCGAKRIPAPRSLLMRYTKDVC